MRPDNFFTSAVEFFRTYPAQPANGYTVAVRSPDCDEDLIMFWDPQEERFAVADDELAKRCLWPRPASQRVYDANTSLGVDFPVAPEVEMVERAINFDLIDALFGVNEMELNVSLDQGIRDFVVDRENYNRVLNAWKEIAIEASPSMASPIHSPGSYHAQSCSGTPGPEIYQTSGDFTEDNFHNLAASPSAGTTPPEFFLWGSDDSDSESLNNPLRPASLEAFESRPFFPAPSVVSDRASPSSQASEFQALGTLCPPCNTSHSHRQFVSLELLAHKVFGQPIDRELELGNIDDVASKSVTTVVSDERFAGQKSRLRAGLERVFGVPGNRSTTSTSSVTKGDMETFEGSGVCPNSSFRTRSRLSIFEKPLGPARHAERTYDRQTLLPISSLYLSEGSTPIRHDVPVPLYRSEGSTPLRSNMASPLHFSVDSTPLRRTISVYLNLSEGSTPFQNTIASHRRLLVENIPLQSKSSYRSLSPLKVPSTSTQRLASTSTLCIRSDFSAKDAETSLPADDTSLQSNGSVPHLSASSQCPASAGFSRNSTLGTTTPPSLITSFLQNSTLETAVSEVISVGHIAINSEDLNPNSRQQPPDEDSLKSKKSKSHFTRKLERMRNGLYKKIMSKLVRHM